MANTIHVDIVSAERELFSGEATMVFAPAVQGEVGIAPRHTPLLTPLNAGDVRVQTEDGEEEIIYISGGMLEVQPHIVTVLSDTALRAEDIDEEAALKAKEDAERALADRQADIDEARARAELVQAAAQLAALRKLRQRGR
jgi:F-type H+-transporting ATPase subunit epsilon